VETPIGCKQLQYTFVRTSADSGVEWYDWREKNKLSSINEQYKLN
jgi:hypothetical protein